MDTVFFIASKLVWLLLRPETLLVLLFGVGVLAAFVRRDTLARRSLGAAMVMTLAIGALPVAERTIRPLETWFPVNPALGSVNGIIILGGGLLADASTATGLPQVSDAGDRLIAGLLLARAHPHARVIYSGGAGGGESAEADAAAAVLLAAGLDPDRLIRETLSRNTAENARLSQQIVAPEPEEHWVLVTSAFHMPRAMATFCAAGWRNMTPYPVDHRDVGATRLHWDLAERLAILNLAAKEWIGLVAYRATGRTARLFVNGC